MASAIPADFVKELAPAGELRAAINLGNSLLVTGRANSGEPIGVAPDMARAVAELLGVPIRYVTYDKPSELAHAVTGDAWDMGLIGAEPERARHIAFTDAYAETEATYLVPASSDVQTPNDIDEPDKRIAAAECTACGLWLDRHIKRAELFRSGDMESACRQIIDQELDALAGLRSRLIRDAERLPDRAPRRNALQPVQASSSVSIDAPDRSSTSSLPNLDCKAMKTLDNF